MRNRKLTKLITLFDDEEMEDLERFLISPFFNTNQTIVQLFHFYKKHYPDFKDEAFSDVEAWKSLQLNGNFQKPLLNQYVTKLYKLADLFIGTKLLKEDKYLLSIPKGDYYLFKKNSKYFTEQTHRDFTTTFKKQSKHPVTDFYAHYHIELMLLNLFSANIATRKRSEQKLITNQALDHYYIIEKLRLITVAEHQAILENTTSESMPMTQEVVAFATKELANLPLLGQLWYHAYQLTLAPASLETYTKLKSFWLNHLSAFSVNDNLAIHATLHLAIKAVYPNDRRKSNEEYFEGQLILIKNQWLVKQGLMQSRSFGNMVYLGISQGELKWVKAFIKSHINYIAVEVREQVKQFNLARLYFAEGKHNEALRLTADLHAPDVAISIGIKRLRIKIFYEQDRFDLLEATANSFRVFLHRITGVRPVYKSAHIAFVQNLMALYRIKIGDKGLNELLALKATFTPANGIPEYDWLYEKIEELEEAYA